MTKDQTSLNAYTGTRSWLQPPQKHHGQARSHNGSVLTTGQSLELGRFDLNTSGMPKCFIGLITQEQESLGAGRVAVLGEQYGISKQHSSALPCKGTYPSNLWHCVSDAMLLVHNILHLFLGAVFYVSSYQGKNKKTLYIVRCLQP